MFTCPKSRNLCHQEVQKAPTETFYVVGIMDFLFMAAGITSYNIIKSTNRSDLLIMERCSDSYQPVIALIMQKCQDRMKGRINSLKKTPR